MFNQNMVKQMQSRLLKMQEESYDLVLLDLRIEGEADGLDYLVRLQKTNPLLRQFAAHAVADEHRLQHCKSMIAGIG